MSTIYTKAEIINQLLSEQDDVMLNDETVGKEGEKIIEKVNRRIQKEKEKLMQLSDSQLLWIYRKQMGCVGQFAPGLFIICTEFEYRTLLMTTV